MRRGPQEPTKLKIIQNLTDLKKKALHRCKAHFTVGGLFEEWCQSRNILDVVRGKAPECEIDPFGDPKPMGRDINSVMKDIPYCEQVDVAVSLVGG